jgi:ubiquinone/menaquinone biosynthesis C-methylase UbiE
VNLAHVLALFLAAQVAREANVPYATEESRKALADQVLTGPQRDLRQRPSELVAALDIKPGMTVADVGTGAGYMLPYLSRAVGPKGRLIAQDIFKDLLDRARRTPGLNNATFIQGNERDTRLPSGCCDLVLMLDVYHHLDYPEPVLATVRRALKPAARLTVVDYYKRGPWVQHIRVDQPVVIKEIEAEGFRLAGTRDFAPDQYILFFESSR